MIKIHRNSLIFTIILSMASILFYTYLIFVSHNNIYDINYFNRVQNVPNKKLNIFFDLGANKGDSVLNFLNINPSSQGGNINKEKRFNLTLETNEWIIYLFEANKVFDDKLIKVKNVIQKLNHMVYLNSQTAAWISDGTIDFYLDTVNKDVDYWGSSLNANHVSLKFNKVELKFIL
jgi:hypothetical protein